MWTFDSQHKYLVELFKDLSIQVSSSEIIGVKVALRRFRSFVTDHFSAEEHYMRQMDYKFYDAHKAQHDRFLQDISAIEPEELSGEIIATWAAWWLCHIPFSDRPYGSNLKSVNWSN
jgi:hemerythrin-like metal-binding protein